MLKLYQETVRWLLNQSDFPGVSAEELELFKSQFRASAFTCPLKSCPRATLGFETEKSLFEHKTAHLRRFRCTVPDCKFPPFASTQALKSHANKYHNPNPPPKSIRSIGGSVKRSSEQTLHHHAIEMHTTSKQPRAQNIRQTRLSQPTQRTLADVANTGKDVQTVGWIVGQQKETNKTGHTSDTPTETQTLSSVEEPSFLIGPDYGLSYPCLTCGFHGTYEEFRNHNCIRRTSNREGFEYDPRWRGHASTLDSKPSGSIEIKHTETDGARAMTSSIPEQGQTSQNLGDASTPHNGSLQPVSLGKVFQWVNGAGQEDEIQHGSSISRSNTTQNEGPEQQHRAPDEQARLNTYSTSVLNTDQLQQTTHPSPVLEPAASSTDTTVKGLSVWAVKRIREHILRPLSNKPTLGYFRLIILDLPRRIQSKEFICLRDLEKFLMSLKMTYSSINSSELWFTSARCIQNTVEYLSDRELIRSGEPPYTTEYFVKLFEHINYNIRGNNLHFHGQGFPSRGLRRFQVNTVLLEIHTSISLDADSSEYMPHKIDRAGETKIFPNGQLKGNREYRHQIFLLPGRGNHYFMMAAECASSLQYYNTALLFEDNKSLYEIIITERDEKEYLYRSGILSSIFLYHTVSIVSARSIFREFGYLAIMNGKRLIDDYWESAMRKYGLDEPF